MSERERHDPTMGSRITYEHHHRYAFASEQVAGLNVLDVACGQGYGTAMLAASASSVEGIDIDPRAIAAANALYGKLACLKFTTGAACELPFSDGAFDAVVSFGALDPLTSPQVMIAEVLRVLKPGGFAIISTPAKRVTAGAAAVPEPKRASGMDVGGFVELLRDRFSNVAIFGQRMIVASSISPIGDGQTAPNAADYRGYREAENGSPHPESVPGVVRPADPEHIVCIVANTPLPHLTGSDSMFLMASVDLWAEQDEMLRRAYDLQSQDSDLKARLDELNDLAHKLDLAEAKVDALTQVRASLERELALQAKQIDGADLSIIGPLMEELSGGPIDASIPNLVRLLSQVSVRVSTLGMKVEEMDALRSKAERLQSEVECQAAHVREAQADNTRLGDTTKQADETIKDLLNRLEQAEASLATLAASKQDLLTELSSVQADVEEQSSILQTAASRAQETSAIYAQQAQRQSELLAQAARDITLAAEQKTTLEAALEREALVAQQLQSEIDHLTNRLFEREDQLASSETVKAAVEERIIELADVNADLEAEKLALQEALETARGREKNVQDELEAARRRETIVQEELAERIRTERQLTEARRQLDTDLAATQALLLKQADVIETLERKTTEAENLVQNAGLKIESLEARLSAHEPTFQMEKAGWLNRENALLSDVEHKTEVITALSRKTSVADTLIQDANQKIAALEATVAHRMQAEAADGEARRAESAAIHSERLAWASDLKAEVAKRQTAEGLVDTLRAEVSTTGRARTGTLRRAADGAFNLGLKQRQGEALSNDLARYRQRQSAEARMLDAWRAVRAESDNAARLISELNLPAPSLSAVATLEGVRRGKKNGLRGALAKLAPPPAQTNKRLHPDLSDELMKVLFDADHYLHVSEAELQDGEQPIEHYMRVGRAEGRSPHPLIDIEWFAAQSPEGGETRFDLVAYLTNPRLFSISPHPLFDAAYYLDMNEDVRAASANPLAHYLLHGWREGRRPNRLFDSALYLLNNQDVLASGTNPLTHYVRYGAGEARKASPLFDAGFYLERYSDVAASGMDAFTHFVAYGRAEGRLPSSSAEQTAHVEAYFGGRSTLDILLDREPPQADRLRDPFWPPQWNGRYWLPQRLRDLIIDRFDERSLDLYIHLFSVIDAYADRPETFDHSGDCERLIMRARDLAKVEAGFSPTVSIVMPVFNNLLYTLTSIVSVLEITPNYAFEIIIGDDRSSDRTEEAIRAIGGLVKHVRNSTNLGFVGNCNAAAKTALGDHLVFLNNDTIALPGWLDQLIVPFETDASIGLTGSKLLNGDGTLQEAGGVFWSDGSAWNFGRNNDPMLPEFNYLKDVDYVSGAAIAVPTVLWREMGGFDPLFSPAYCEDSDLAFRLRAAGYRTVYNPHSVIVHHEGRSHGTDVASGIKAYQAVNQRKFLARWGDVLAREHFPNATNSFLARDRSRNKPHILVVDHYVPRWDQDAGSRTLYLYIKMFIASGFAVTFWSDNLAEDRDYAGPLQALGVEVIYSAAYVDHFPDWIAENGQYFDYAFLSRPHIATKYIDGLKKTGWIKTIYYGHDLHFKRLRSAYEIDKNPATLAEANDWEAVEIDVCSRCDVILYPDQGEVDLVLSRVPPRVTGIAFPITIFDAEEQAAAAAAVVNGRLNDPHRMMFVGGFSHSPNLGAVVWFVKNVLPKLVQADPRFHLSIAGSNAPHEILSLAGDNVTILGRISDDDLSDLYRRSAMAVVPLLYGGGVKGKVIEAMARGVPVVMTNVGAQGIVNADEISTVEDSADKMADAIIASVTDRRSVLEKAAKALEFIDRYYSERAVRELLGKEIPELASSPPAMTERPS